MNFNLIFFPLFLSGVLASPVKYDQRQDGEVNVRADLQNFVIIALVPKLDGVAAGSALLNVISKAIPQRKSDAFALRRSDESDEVFLQARNEPFVEKKNTPYHVDITQAESNLKDSGAGRKSSGTSYSAGVSKLRSSVESPVPDILPVKDNKYISTNRKNGRRSLESNNVDDFESGSGDFSSGINDDDVPSPPQGVQYWLLGSRSNCGPDAYRDDSLLCVPCPKGQVVEFETGVCKEI